MFDRQCECACLSNGLHTTYLDFSFPEASGFGGAEMQRYQHEIRRGHDMIDTEELEAILDAQRAAFWRDYHDAVERAERKRQRFGRAKPDSERPNRLSKLFSPTR